jgi:putative peptidoglycan lipid II flippase
MIIKSGLIVASLTLLSRVFGLARELFIASTFGSSATADCVNIAFRFPNLFRRIFGEGALSAVFVPFYSEKLVESEEKAMRFSGEIFSLLLICLIILTVLLQLVMPQLMFLIAPGFYEDKEKFELSVILCRITTPYILFISISALFGGMLNSVKKFAAFAFAPVLLNISIIVTPMILQGSFEAHYSIAYGILLGGIAQIMFMLYCLRRAGLLFPLTFNTKDKDVRQAITNMGPASMSYGAQQLNLFISQSISSFIPGAVSILAYADRLYQLPLALIGASFATVLLPELSKIYKEKNYPRANDLLNKSLTVGIFISVPAACGLFMLANPIVYLIYERAAFLSSDTSITAITIMGFSFGLPAFILSKIITPIFYANLDTKTPLKITVYSIFINTSLNILLMIPFGIIGISIATSISAWVNLAILYVYAKKYGDFKIKSSTLIFTVRVIICSLMMVIFLYYFKNNFSQYMYVSSILAKAITMFIVISLALIVYGIAAFIQKLHAPLYERLKKKI